MTLQLEMDGYYPLHLKLKLKFMLLIFSFILSLLTHFIKLALENSFNFNFESDLLNCFSDIS